MEQNAKMKALIMDTAQKTPYIDELRQAYVFLIKSMAVDFVQTTPGTHHVNVAGTDFKTVCSDCFAAGATSMIVYGNKGEENIPLNPKHLERRYYNGHLTANIRRLAKTKKKNYLKDMAQCRFVVPIKITNEPEVTITYATATSKDGSYIYLAFTDLNEFDKWVKVSKKEDYRPLEVNATGLKRIGKKHGFLLNVCSSNMALSKDMLKHIKTEDDEEELE